jgi:ABC-type Fe3+-hydroxamate transport system substrate-binding protein
MRVGWVVGTDVTEVLTRVDWQVVAPNGQGSFHPTNIDTMRTLDPDVLIFSDPAMRHTLRPSEAWKPVRAVREGRALVAPSLPSVGSRSRLRSIG